MLKTLKPELDWKPWKFETMSMPHGSWANMLEGKLEKYKKI